MARIKGKSETREFVPKVKLVSATTDPIGTIVAMWIGSRYEDSLDAHKIEELYNGTGFDQETVNKLLEDYPELSKDGTDYKSVINNVASMVLKSGLPPLDSLIFNFEISDANVAFREQLVRGRQPQNFWMQTSRTADLTSMDVNMSSNIGYYGGEKAEEIYKDAVDNIRKTYETLVSLGVPTEDIRLIPQGMIHRIYWMVPYRTLKGALTKRLSWIAQASLWSSIIEGIQECIHEYSELLYDDLGTPADVKIKNGKIVDHTYDNENLDRYVGNDYQPCDPLWLAYRGYKLPEDTNMEMYNRMKQYYIKLWSSEILDILGWDRSDPSKPGYFDEPNK